MMFVEFDPTVKIMYGNSMIDILRKRKDHKLAEDMLSFHNDCKTFELPSASSCRLEILKHFQRNIKEKIKKKIELQKSQESLPRRLDLMKEKIMLMMKIIQHHSSICFCFAIIFMQ